ncbi:MAG: PorV/PorQ family protein [Calditrichae bacterium]|nr:PorV/PorQ family protein [Calditrichia bacterium]
MRNTLILILFIFIHQVIYAQLLPNLGGQRVGTSAAQFLKIGVGPRAEAMGQAYIAIANDAEALFYNPAGISQFDKNEVFFSNTQWIVDIQLEYLGLVYHLDGVNTVGLAVTYLHTEEMEETTELFPYGTGNFFRYADALIGLSYSRKMTDKFSFGISVKYMHETLAELTMSSLLFDLGTYYKTGWKSIRFAVAVPHFGGDMAPSGSFTYKNLDNEQITKSDFQKFPPPILFRIGVAGELYQTENNMISGSVQLNHPNDNVENVNFGLEYWWRKTFALRAGFATARTEENFSTGFGLLIPLKGIGVGVDYSFSNFGRLGYVNRFALNIQF